MKLKKSKVKSKRTMMIKDNNKNKSRTTARRRTTLRTT